VPRGKKHIVPEQKKIMLLTLEGISRHQARGSFLKKTTKKLLLAWAVPTKRP
jgi:hypothetical protein